MQVLSKSLPEDVVMPLIPLYWITTPIGLLMFVYVIYLTRLQRSSGSAISQAPTDEVLERGYLDFFLDGQEALKKITEITLKIGKQYTIATNTMDKNQRKILRINKWQELGIGSNRTRRVYRISQRIARSIDTWCDEIDELRSRYGVEIGTVEECYLGLTESGQVVNSKNEQIILRDAMASGLDGLRGFLQSTIYLKKNTRELRGISAPLNASLNRMNGVLERLIEALKGMVEVFEKLVSALNSRISRT